MASLKVSELRSVIERFADTLEINNGDRDVVRGLRDLCAMFSGNEASTVTVFLKAVGHALRPTLPGNGPPVASIVRALGSLRTFLNDFGRRDLNKCLDSLLDTLRIHADVPISVFVASVKQQVTPAPKPKGKRVVASMNQQLVDDYVERLEAALGDDRRFGCLFDELKTDPRIAQPEAVAIASRFYGRTPNSASRSKALQRVRERHEKLMQFKRQPSTAGRPAA